jgi:hypothetical protein
MRDSRYFEMFEQASNLTTYYTEETGAFVEFGTDDDNDLWMATPRSGKEYFDSFEVAEERVRLLYPDVFLDDDYTDPLGWV